MPGEAKPLCFFDFDSTIYFAGLKPSKLKKLGAALSSVGARTVVITSRLQNIPEDQHSFLYAVNTSYLCMGDNSIYSFPDNECLSEEDNPTSSIKNTGLLEDILKIGDDKIVCKIWVKSDGRFALQTNFWSSK